MRVIKDKKTNKIIVKDIAPVIKLPKVRPSVYVSQQDIYGNVEVTVTNKKVIKESKEIQTVVQNVYREKPQLIKLPAVAVQTVTYGNIEENTVVFS